MIKKRPVNLDLTSLRYPPMAIVSILHRISGLVIFLLLPIILYFLHLSLHSEQTFSTLQAWSAHSCFKLTFWVFCTAMIYHVLAGIRHLSMDFGLGETVAAGRVSALMVILLAVLLAVILGIYLW